MNYITVKEAAQKWSITQRRVQELCKNGTIREATRLGKAWMIPEHTQKPNDGRIKHIKEENLRHKHIKLKLEGKFMFPPPRQNPFFTHTDLYSTPGTAKQVVESFSEYPETAKIIQIQFDYQQGNIDKILDNADYFLNEHKGFLSTINAGMMLSFAATWKGDAVLWRKARNHMYSAPCKSPKDEQILKFWIAVTDSAIYNTQDFPQWFTEGRFDILPFDSLSAARIFYIKYMFIQAHEVALGRLKFPDVEGLGLIKTLPYIIEPMLSQAKAEKTLFPECYLHLIAAAVYHYLGQDDKAIPHIDDAIDICLPDSLYTPLAEYRSHLDKLLDDRLMLKDEAFLAKLKVLQKEMHAGTVKLHNTVMNRNISSVLTAREREVSKLAAFGLSNIEIAERLHIEVSSVKQYIFSAMNKVGAEKRAELGLYV